MSLEIQSTTSPQSVDLIRTFLKTHVSGVLATADKAAQPHAAVIYFSLDDDFCLLFATKTETQKYKNMEENDQVCFAVYDEKQQTTLQVVGRVETIEDSNKKDMVINGMAVQSAARSNRETAPADKLFAGDYVALKLIPAVIKMAIYARPDAEGDDIYETLLFSQ